MIIIRISSNHSPFLYSGRFLYAVRSSFVSLNVVLAASEIIFEVFLLGLSCLVAEVVANAKAAEMIITIKMKMKATVTTGTIIVSISVKSIFPERSSIAIIYFTSSSTNAPG